MSASRERSGLGGAAAVIGAGLVMVVCCAGPPLVAGGALGAVGGALANPWLITMGAVVLLAGTAYALRCRVRRRHGAGPEDCCPNVPGPPPHPVMRTIRAVPSTDRMRPPRGKGVLR